MAAQIIIHGHWKIRYKLYAFDTELDEFHDSTREEYIPKYPGISNEDSVLSRVNELHREYPNIAEIRLIEKSGARIDEVIWRKK